MQQKSRRCKIRTISYLTAFILVLGIWGISATVKKNQYARIISASRQQALSDLGSYMNSIETSLTKGLYCGTQPMLSEIATSLWKESGGAKMSLSQLGDSEVHLLGTYKFLTQVGDYTLYLSKKIERGEEITADEYETLLKFRDYARKYSQQISFMQENLFAGNLSFDDIDGALLDQSQPNIIKFSDAAADSENNVSDYPTLLYDGPFSDNLDTKKSQLLSSLQPVSEEAARSIAVKLLGVSKENITTLESEESNMPSYIFQCEQGTVAVTKQGGYPRYMLTSAFAGEEKISVSQAIEKGKQFLDRNGYPNMKDSYYSKEDGIATINYALDADGVYCYPDLIKVSVALDTGTVVSFDATGYLMNHISRSVSVIDSAAMQRLAGKVSSMLTVQSSKTAMIPTDSGGEVLTAEFLCKSKDGTDVLVYINPESELEEEILILTYSDEGILTR